MAPLCGKRADSAEVCTVRRRVSLEGHDPGQRAAARARPRQRLERLRDVVGAGAAGGALRARRPGSRRLLAEPAARADRLGAAGRRGRGAARARDAPRGAFLRRVVVARRGGLAARARRLADARRAARLRARTRASGGRGAASGSLEPLLDGPADDLREFLRRFLALVGSDFDPPDPLPRAARAGRPGAPRRAAPPGKPSCRRRSSPAPFPCLVVSGGTAPAFDAVCDVLDGARSRAERAVLARRRSQRAARRGSRSTSCSRASSQAERRRSASRSRRRIRGFATLTISST